MQGKRRCGDNASAAKNSLELRPHDVGWALRHLLSEAFRDGKLSFVYQDHAKMGLPIVDGHWRRARSGRGAARRRGGWLAGAYPAISLRDG